MTNVIDKFITPLTEFFGGSLSPKQAEIFSKKLEPFDNNTLERAVDWLMENHMAKSFPPLSKCIDACRSNTGVESNSSIADNWSSPQRGSTRDCEQAMKSPEGQFALKEGYGRDVWVAIKYDKHTKLSKGFFEQCRRGLDSMQEACNILVSPDNGVPDTKSLLSMAEGMRNEEKQLREKYYVR